MAGCDWKLANGRPCICDKGSFDCIGNIQFWDYCCVTDSLSRVASCRKV